LKNYHIKITRRKNSPFNSQIIGADGTIQEQRADRQNNLPHEAGNPRHWRLIAVLLHCHFKGTVSQESVPTKTIGV
jgi:hypothetical protein